MLLKLFIIVAGSLIMTALLTPAVFSAILMVSPSFEYPFSRVFNRVAMVAALGFVILYRKEFGLKEVRYHFKQEGARGGIKNLLLGVFLSAISSAVLLYVLVEWQALSWKNPDNIFYNFSAGKLGGTVVGAIAASVIEESFFRVILLKGLMRRFSFITSAALSSGIYSAVHFITPVKSFVYDGFVWYAGFEYLGVIFDRFFNISTLYGMVGLFMVGLTLCYVIWASGSIFLCIGLHTGWILLIKISGMLANANVPPEMLSGAGGRYFIIAQPITWVYLTIFFAGLSIYLSRKYAKEE